MGKLHAARRSFRELHVASSLQVDKLVAMNTALEARLRNVDTVRASVAALCHAPRAGSPLTPPPRRCKKSGYSCRSPE